MSESTVTSTPAGGLRPRLPRWVAIVVALVSVAAALATGHLVAVFTGVRSSPYVAVANAVRDLSPSALTNWAIDTLGSWKQPALFAGVAVVMALLAVLTGLLSRRSATPGSVVIVVFGVVGGLAVYQADTSKLGLLAPAAALLAGLVVFRRLHELALRDLGEVSRSENLPDTGESPDPETPNQPSVSGGAAGRRRFLVAAGGTALGAGVAGFGGQLLISAQSAAGSRASVRELRPVNSAPPVPDNAAFTKLGTPTFITPNRDFYRVDIITFKVPQVPTSEWQLRIHGMVDEEVTLSYDDIRDMPLIERTITMVCVSNPVGGHYISTAKFVGVELRELLNRAGVRPGAEQLYSTSVDGFSIGTPVETVMEPERGALLAIGMNDKPLPFEHGFPARMVVPGLYGYVSATKWVVDMEVTTWEARDAYWLKRGWAERAPIKTESRIDQPSAFETVPAGRVPVSGVAWRPHIGIKKVEVSLDDGPWREARLGAEYNIDTWRMWYTYFDISPGSHQVTVRATDKSGYTQTKRRTGTVPDGATGWHTVAFSAQ